MYFLLRHFKQYHVPRVLEDPFCPHAGYFQWPEVNLVQIGEKELLLPCGALVYNPNLVDNEDHLANTLAHEYRHFLQFCLYGVWKVPDWSNEKALENYWINHPCERDALSFSCALASHQYSFNLCCDNQIPLMSRAESLLLPVSLLSC